MVQIALDIQSSTGGATDVTLCPVQHTYGLLMDAYASIDDLTGCQRVLESMAADRIVPNAIIRNAFLKARMAMPQNGLEVRLQLLLGCT